MNSFVAALGLGGAYAFYQAGPSWGGAFVAVVMFLVLAPLLRR